MSLFIISAGLLMVLLSIHRGLEHLERTRAELQTALDVDAAAAALALDLDPPAGPSWKTEEGSPLPEWTLLIIRRTDGDLPVTFWLVPAREEKAAGAA